MSQFVHRRLTDLLSFIVDNRGRTCPTAETGIPLIATNCVKDDELYPVFEKVRFVDEATYETWFRAHPEPGDILFVCKGSPGRTALVPDPVSFCIAQDMVALRADSTVINNRYLYYVLQSQETRHQIENMHVGTMIPHFKKGDFPKLVLSIHADLGEQYAIAEVLGALDDKIAANTKLAKTADELAGKLFDHAVALLPTQPLSSILTPILGGTPSRSNLGFWDGEEPWASARDITGAPFAVVLDTEEKITSAAVEKTKAKPLPAGSVILTARGTVGAVARLATPVSFNQSCYGFLPESLPPSLLYFSVLRATAQAKALVHGSVFDTITKRTFDHVLIPEFGEAADSLEDQISPFLDLVTASVRENATLAATRDALLPQLMSGKLRVKDAEKVLESAL